LIIEHDGIVHHPFGGGSYVYKSTFIDYVLSQINKDEVKISIGAQPNSSPHFGTLIVFCLAFALSEILMKKNSKLKVSVSFEMVDTAPSNTFVIDGLKYQISLRENETDTPYYNHYSTLLNSLNKLSGVNYEIRRQHEFNNQLEIHKIVPCIIRQQKVVAPILDPNRGILKIRVACPKCGLTDKTGALTQLDETVIKTCCPLHGQFIVNITSESEKLEYNTPLRNLIRALVYSEQNKNPSVSYQWLRITGSDYTGFYQEQLLYKCVDLLGYIVSELPMIIYTPLILDWSGGKLSKSLYVNKNAYSYLPPYLINYESFDSEVGETGLNLLYSEVTDWINHPYKLFRHYTVYYFINLFDSNNIATSKQKV
jgi:hypothetical protein